MGMGLYKLGFFSAARPRKSYITLVILAAAGLALVVYGVRQRFAHDWEPFYSFFIATQYNYWGSLLVSGGYVGAVMLVCRSDALRRVTRPFAATGRMAFSNYVGQSLIGSFVFYGTGLGYYAEIGRLGQISIVAAVCALQLVVSPIWLRGVRYGPLEWLWRTLTYGKRQPFRI